MIADPRRSVYVSAASARGIAIKVAIGKLAVPPNTAEWLPVELEATRFLPLPINLQHALAVEGLPMHHNDPFDRLLIAQAIVEGLTIITGDASFGSNAVQTIQA